MDGGWLTARVQCRLCRHRHVAVAPVETEGRDLECPRCGNMTCDADDAEERQDHPMTDFWRWLREVGLGG